MTLRRAALIHKALLRHLVSEGELVLFPCPCSSSRSLPLLVTWPLTSPPSHTLAVNENLLTPCPQHPFLQSATLLSGPAWPP